jgi:ParB family transcriptional regulator, chromosome partitioning protein
MSARNRREAEIAVVRPAQPRTTIHALAGATERRLPGAMEVPIDQVAPDPSQPRQDWEHNDGARHLDELAESVREFGILQPLVVREDGHVADGRQRYLIIAGGRRYAAAQRADLASVPVVVRGEESSRVRILQLIENLQRQELSPLDEARAYQELIDLEKLSPPMLAARLHLSAQHVRDRLRVLADQALADAVERQQISATAARDIMQLPEEAFLSFRARVLNGEAIQSSDVAAVRMQLSAAGIINPRRKTVRPKKQTSFVPTGATTELTGKSLMIGLPARNGLIAEDMALEIPTCIQSGIGPVSEPLETPDSLNSSANALALLIDGALRGALRAEIIERIAGQNDTAAEVWWLLVCRHLRERLLTP